MFFKANNRNQTDQTNQMKEKIVYLFVWGDLGICKYVANQMSVKR